MLPPVGVGKLNAAVLPPLDAGIKGGAADPGCMFAWTFDCFQDTNTPGWDWGPGVGSVGADAGRKETLGIVCAGAYCNGVLAAVVDWGTLSEVLPIPILGAWVPK